MPIFQGRYTLVFRATLYQEQIGENTYYKYERAHDISGLVAQTVGILSYVSIISYYILVRLARSAPALCSTDHSHAVHLGHLRRLKSLVRETAQVPDH